MFSQEPVSFPLQHPCTSSSRHVTHRQKIDKSSSCSDGNSPQSKVSRRNAVRRSQWEDKLLTVSRRKSALPVEKKCRQLQTGGNSQQLSFKRTHVCIISALCHSAVTILLLNHPLLYKEILLHFLHSTSTSICIPGHCFTICQTQRKIRNEQTTQLLCF